MPKEISPLELPEPAASRSVGPAVLCAQDYGAGLRAAALKGCEDNNCLLRGV